VIFNMHSIATSLPPWREWKLEFGPFVSGVESLRVVRLCVVEHTHNQTGVAGALMK